MVIFSLSIIDLIESGYSICESILFSTVSLNLIGCAVETNKPLQLFKLFSWIYFFSPIFPIAELGSVM